MTARVAVRAKWALIHEDGEARIATDRWIVVEGDRIAAIARERPDAVDVAVDRQNLLVLPGLIDLHNHVFTEMLIRGRSEDLASASYETTLVYGLLMPFGQFAMAQLSPEEIEAIAELGLMQLMKSGVTTLMEPFRAALAGPFVAVAERVGLRFYAAPYLFSTPDLEIGPEGKPIYRDDAGGAETASLDAWRRLYSRHNGRASDRIRVALAPHATDTCGPDVLRATQGLAQEHGCLATIHVAQSRSEVETSHARYGRSPAAYLEWVGLLGPDVLLAHCVHASDDDLDLVRRTGTTVINCPSSFARGGVAAAFHRFRQAGIRTVVGTDGYILDMIGELRTAGLVAKLTAHRSDVASARELIDSVTRQAAAALGRNDLGRLAPGAKADMVAIDLGGGHVIPVKDPLNALIWRAHASDLWASVIDGRVVLNECRYLMGDEAAIAGRGAAAVAKVWNIADAAGFFRQ
jgi:cytosine/adenosine deaminase-related metal-dependent hydrolase